MKKYLSRFAVWLYRKTKPDEEVTPQQMFMGVKVLVSDHLPKDTMIMSSGKYKNMMDALVYEQINLKP